MGGADPGPRPGFVDRVLADLPELGLDAYAEHIVRQLLETIRLAKAHETELEVQLVDCRRRIAALERAGAASLGEPLPPPGGLLALH